MTPQAGTKVGMGLIVIGIFLQLLAVAIFLFGCTAPTDPAPVIQPPMDKRQWDNSPDDGRDTFPDTLGEPDEDTLTYRQRGIPVHHRDQMPDYWN